MATEEQRKQVRLALVVEGGVSLAVWMSGVVHEVDLLRRAAAPADRREPVPDGPDGEALRRWRALCEKLNVEVVVDIVAGTSAGGLNGALLASAIASGSPLPRLRDLWLETAELKRGRLLDEGDRGPVPSVLDGKYFAREVTKAVQQALAPGRPAAHPVSLLTTATALGQQSAKWTDSTGTEFQVDDHRRVFLFRHDPDRRSYSPCPDKSLPDDITSLFAVLPCTDLKAEHAGAVALAVRATAGFPGAFAPVDEGELADFRSSAGMSSAKLVDGGVLDNTPFEPLLAEVARREVNGPWQRVIGYVVANDALESVPDDRLALDGVGVLSAALRLPAETSFRNGVEGLAERSLEAERLVSGPEALFSELLDGVDVQALTPLYRVYRRVRTASGLLDADTARHVKTRPVTVPPLPPEDLSDVASPWVPGADLAAALRPGDFYWGTAVADRSVRLLLRHLHECAGDNDKALEHLSTVMTCIAAVRDHIEQSIKNSHQPDGIARINEAVVAADAPRVLGVLVQDAIEIYTAARGGCTSEAVRRALLAVEIVTHAAAGYFPFSRPSRFDFVRMGPDIPTPALPSSNGSDWGGEQKLYGRQLLHFGAFGSREWRRHDYVWGRLDGAAHLVRMLIGPTDAQARTGRTVAAQDAVLVEEDVTAAEMAETTQKLRDLDSRGTLDLLRESAEGQNAIRDVASDVLRTLLPEMEPTTPGGPSRWPWARQRRGAPQSSAPRRSVVLGRWASVVLAKPVARGVAPLTRPWLVRALTRRPRARIWRTILSPSPAQTRSRSTR